MIKGVTVALSTKTQDGVDDFNRPIWVKENVNVDNILIEPVSNEAVVSELELNGKHIAYILHIPKGDNHNWKDTEVTLPAPWNVTVKTYGDCLIYDPDLTPLDWDKKVKVELYE